MIKDLVGLVPRLNDYYNTGPVQRAAVEDFADAIVHACIEIVSKQCASPTAAQALKKAFNYED